MPETPTPNPQDRHAAYQAAIAVITNLGTIRFAQAALYIAAQLVLLNALAQKTPHTILAALQPFVPTGGLVLYVAIVILELRNSAIADKAHETARSLEAQLDCLEEHKVLTQIAKTKSKITHWLGLHITYGLFGLMWAILFAAKF
ncbi:MAG: hypothetical protein AB1452_16715 [Pseudomonadota bacterium]